MFATPLYKLLELNVITVSQCFNHIFCFNFVGFVVDAMFPYWVTLPCFHNLYVLESCRLCPCTACLTAMPLVTSICLDILLLALDHVAWFWMFGTFLPRFACWYIFASFWVFLHFSCIVLHALPWAISFCVFLHLVALWFVFVNIFAYFLRALHDFASFLGVRVGWGGLGWDGVG